MVVRCCTCGYHDLQMYERWGFYNFHRYSQKWVLSLLMKINIHLHPNSSSCYTQLKLKIVIYVRGGAEEKRLGTTVLKHKQTIHAYNNRLRRLLNVQYHLKIFEKCAVGENGMMGQNIFLERDFERNSNNWMGFSYNTIWVWGFKVNVVQPRT